MATGFKSGGRPPGGKNKATLARERAIKAAAVASPGAFLGDAWSLLASVYKCSELPIEIRIEAAKAAIAYEKPRLAPVAPPSEPEELAQKAQKLHALLAEMRATVGGDRTNGHSLA